MFTPSDPLPTPSDFAQRLRVILGSAAPLPIAHHGTPVSRIDPALQSTSHVFLRVDAVRKPLVPPYLGPFRVLGRAADLKTFDILQNQKSVTVTVDRLKPAHFLPVSAVPLSPSSAPTDPQEVQASPVPVSSTQSPSCLLYTSDAADE